MEKYGMVEIFEDGKVLFPKFAEPIIDKLIDEAKNSILNDGTLKGFAMALHYKIAEYKGSLSLLI